MQQSFLIGLLLSPLAFAAGAIPDEPDEGVPTPEEVDAPQTGNPWEYLRTKYDADEDGIISLEEYGRPREFFDRLDRDANGSLEASDFDDGSRTRGSRRNRDRDSKGRSKRPVAPKVGAQAPDFKLPILVLPEPEEEGSSEPEARPETPTSEKPTSVTLSDFSRDERPVALIFGSYT